MGDHRTPNKLDNIKRSARGTSLALGRCRNELVQLQKAYGEAKEEKLKALDIARALTERIAGLEKRNVELVAEKSAIAGKLMKDLPEYLFIEKKLKVAREKLEFVKFNTERCANHVKGRDVPFCTTECELKRAAMEGLAVLDGDA